MVKPFDGQPFEFSIEVLIVGAGACGLSAALAARDSGAQVLVLERDAVPSGTTSMSTGLIPGAATRAQIAAGVADDSAELFAADLARKVGDGAEACRLLVVCEQATRTIDWLIEDHAIPLTLFPASASLPGHSRARLHGTPNRTGEELNAALLVAAQDVGADILTNARVVTLLADADQRIRGVEAARPDGNVERIGCDTLVLASCGFAANHRLVAEHIPEIGGMIAHTHPGAQGDALRWGEQLGAAMGDLAAYQGHANLASGQGLLVSWLAITEGGFQINAAGQRFANEALGYSEQAANVAAQPGSFAWTIYDSRIDKIMQELAEYRDVRSAGAPIVAGTLTELAGKIRIAPELLQDAMTSIQDAAASGQADRFGRHFDPSDLLAPDYVAVKVTPALFHTQGGLEVDCSARVLNTAGAPFPNLFAGGGAARGVSGSGASGYVAGNGLMTATTFGRLAGETAAAQAAAMRNGQRI